MRQKFSIYIFNSNFFHDQICECFDIRFIGRVLHNFTFHDNFARFSYVHDLLGDVICYAHPLKRDIICRTRYALLPYMPI